MMIATMTWLVDRTTFVAVLASLVMGRANEAIRPVIANVRKDDRGRLVHRRHAAASAVPAAPPSRRAAHAMFITGIRAKWSSNTSVSSIGTPAARAARYTMTLASAATSAAARPTCQSGRSVHGRLGTGAASWLVVMRRVLPVRSTRDREAGNTVKHTSLYCRPHGLEVYMEIGRASCRERVERV